MRGVFFFIATLSFAQTTKTVGLAELEQLVSAERNSYETTSKRLEEREKKAQEEFDASGFDMTEYGAWAAKRDQYESIQTALAAIKKKGKLKADSPADKPFVERYNKTMDALTICLEKELKATLPNSSNCDAHTPVRKKEGNKYVVTVGGAPLDPNDPYVELWTPLIDLGKQASAYTGGIDASMHQQVKKPDSMRMDVRDDYTTLQNIRTGKDQDARLKASTEKALVRLENMQTGASKTGLCSESTGTIRLDAPGQPMENVLPQQQGWGTCYANSISLLYEAALGQPVSYMDLAINESQFAKSSPFSKKEGDTYGGNPYDAALAAQKNGVCPAKYSITEFAHSVDLPEEKRKKVESILAGFETQFSFHIGATTDPRLSGGYLTQKNAMKPEDRTLLIETLQKKYGCGGAEKAPASKDLPQCVDDAVAEWENAFNEIATMKKNLDAIGVAHPMSLDEEATAKRVCDALVANPNMSDSTLLQLVYSPDCLDPKNRIDVSKYEPVQLTGFLGTLPNGKLSDDLCANIYRNDILTALKAGQPLEVSSCQEIFTMESPPTDKSLTESGRCKTKHAMTIAGYKWDPASKSCKVLLWNSSGSVLSARDGEKPWLRWVDEKALRINSTEMVTLNPKP